MQLKFLVLIIVQKEIFESIKQIKLNEKPVPKLNKKINFVLTREEYLKKIEELQKHILSGDCYEINFCQEFFIEDANITPVEIYTSLLEFRLRHFPVIIN